MTEPQKGTIDPRQAQADDTFRHLVENSPFGVYAVDADFRLVQVSAGAQKVFATCGRSSGSTAGRWR